MLFASIALSQAMALASTGLVDGGKTPAVQYAVVTDGAITSAGAAGEANVALRLPATDETRFRIGSITKMFTAVAVMQLVEQGKLSLDDPLAKYDPAFTSAASITVRDLLMHRSGIDDYLAGALASGATQHPTTPTAIAASMRSKPMLSTPGTAFSYSNTNYVLLGLIVQRVSGMPLHAYYRERIFSPSGMTQTFAGPTRPGIPVAMGYASSSNDGSIANPGDMTWYYGCGDALSTAGDLARFDIALMNGRLIKSQTLQDMVEAAKPTTFGRRVYYGLGITTVSSGGGDPFVGHHGGLPGFAAEDEMLLSDRFAVISLGNSTAYPSSVLNVAALRVLYPQRFAVMQAQAVADASAAAANEDPALTQQFTAFFRSILAGALDSSGLSKQMSAALTPQTVAQIGQYFATDGAFQRLRYVSDDTVSGYHRYHYVAVFDKKSQPLMFVRNAAGELDGFFLQ